MNIKQLKQYIQDLPDDMEVSISCDIREGTKDFYKYLKVSSCGVSKVFRIDGTIEEVDIYIP